MTVLVNWRLRKVQSSNFKYQISDIKKGPRKRDALFCWKLQPNDLLNIRIFEFIIHTNYINVFYPPYIGVYGYKR